MRPSPIVAEYQRWSSESPALASASPTAAAARTVTSVTSAFGHRGVEQRPQQERRDRGHDRCGDHRDQEPDEEAPVGAGESEDPAEQRALDLAAAQAVVVLAEARHRLPHRHSPSNVGPEGLDSRR